MATTAQQLSSSCQRISSEDNVFSNTFANSQRTVTAAHYIKGTGSLGRLKYQQKHRSLDASDDELEYAQLSQSTHILGRVKSERLLAFNPDENRLRRTIIVEKCNNSFGFTLQSYGIHYRRDQEIETITYVDYVEYDGPAYRAGMREGDVILSINGVDLEKADHKTLVAFIKSCDTRMRMVVLFEDCVRKVELHMRYIQLQTLLQNKLNELERITLRERELLDGKWKTHSLPARKKASSSPTDNEISTLDGADLACYRPTLSTEDVPTTARYQTTATIIPPPAQFRLSRHYRQPSYVLKPATSINSSGELCATNESHILLKRVESGEIAKDNVRNAKQQQHHHQQKQQQKQKQEETDATNVLQKQQRVKNSTQKVSSNKHCHSHSCNPCLGHFRWKSAQKSAVALTAANGNLNSNNDNVSLDAYDLASPCCDTHCVPTRRRLHHKHHKQRERDCERNRDTENKHRAARPKSQPHATNVERESQKQQQQRQQQQQQQQHAQRHHHHHHHHHAHHHHQQQQQQQQQVSPETKKLQQQQQQQHQQLHACASTGSGSGSLRSQYIDFATGLINYCNLHHSRASNEFPQADGNSYTTSLSTDTLYWETGKGEQQQQIPQQAIMLERQQSSKSRRSYQKQDEHQQQQQQQQQTSQKEQQQQQQTPPRPPPRPQPHALYGGIYQQRYHITATQIQPSQICINPLTSGAATYVQKPRSWDNLTTKAVAMGYGYGYLDTTRAIASTASGGIQQPIKLQIAQQRHSMPRKNPYGRFSAYATANVENYAPPPSQFVEEYTTTTTTTTILSKSTEQLIATPQPTIPQQQQQQQQQQQKLQTNNCGCTTTIAAAANNLRDQAQFAAFKSTQLKMNPNQKLSHYNNCQLGYYSHLPRPTADVGTSTTSVIQDTATVTNNMNVSGVGEDVTTISEVTRL